MTRETIADLAGRAFVYTVLLVACGFAAIGAALLWSYSPVAAALVATHVVCVAGPGAAIRDRRRTLALDTCDYLSDELDARKDADRRADANFLRLDDLTEQRWLQFKTPLALPAATPEPARA